MEFLWSNSHFLTEQFPQLPSDQAIITSKGTALGTASAQTATVSQLGKPRHSWPVQLNIVSR